MADAAPIDLRRRDVHVAAAPLTNLAAIADKLGKIDSGSVTLQIDARPGMSVKYSLRLSGAQLAGWRAACAEEHLPGGIDEWLWQRTICAAQCVAVYNDDVQLVDDDDTPVTFDSPSLQRILGVPMNAPAGATDCVLKLYDNDFAISAAADRIVSDAGFGKAAKAVDPTRGPSKR